MVDNLAGTDIVNQMVNNLSPTLDRVFHALAHPARRTILSHLRDGERNLTELAAPLRMSFPAASKHVRVLEQARLVRRRVVGRTHLCRIEGQPLAQANQWLENYRKVWEANFQRLDELKRQEKRPKTSQGALGPDGRVADALTWLTTRRVTKSAIQLPH